MGGPYLLADIGGTHARFAIERDGKQGAFAVLRCAEYASIGDAIEAYLAQPAAQECGADQVRRIGIAIANPIDGDLVAMTNHHWRFTISGLRRQLKLQDLVVVNDFEALAVALPYLHPHEKTRIGGDEPKPGGSIAVLGAGTGLGVSGLIPTTQGWTALQTEGGHVSFAPADRIELQVLQFAWSEHAHVSAERLLSGMGLELIYRALYWLEHGSEATPALAAPEILARGLHGDCAVCDRTLDVFCRMLGTIAANLALTLGSKGGVYIGGGIVPRLGARFATSGFRTRFEQHGRFSEYLARIPVFVINTDSAALTGVSVVLSRGDAPRPATVSDCEQVQLA